MAIKKNEIPAEKSALHPRNKHRDRYDFKPLIAVCPELANYVKINAYGSESIDFANPKAVKWLNKALLKQYYKVDYWDIPSGYLCPPIPGRADYIHNMADLLASCNKGAIPKGDKINCLDIGTGASCIFPLIGKAEYGWNFVGSDTDEKAIASAQKICSYNPSLSQSVEIRHQENPKDIFHGILSRNEYYDVTVCNPPFHASAEEAQEGTLRKLSSLNQKKVTTPILNFGGQNNELWCDGGEERFVRDMIRQSKQFSTNCLWFSTLIAKKEHLSNIYDALKMAGAADVKTIQMSQGTKNTRVVAWTFLNAQQQQKWVNTRWNIM